jgi:hypothetical protein
LLTGNVKKEERDRDTGESLSLHWNKRPDLEGDLEGTVTASMKSRRRENKKRVNSASVYW